MFPSKCPNMSHVLKPVSLDCCSSSFPSSGLIWRQRHKSISGPSGAAVPLPRPAQLADWWLETPSEWPNCRQEAKLRLGSGPGNNEARYRTKPNRFGRQEADVSVASAACLIMTNHVCYLYFSSYINPHLLILMLKVLNNVNQQYTDIDWLMSAKASRQSIFPLTPTHFPPLALLFSLAQGPKTQALFNLQVRVGELPQLRESKHKFNAFVFGLLK